MESAIFRIYLMLHGEASSWHEENEIVPKTGENQFIRWNNILIRDPLGAVLAAARIGENVTERIQLQRKVASEADQQLVMTQRELHDSLGQELFGISMTARSLAMLVERSRFNSRVPKKTIWP